MNKVDNNPDYKKMYKEVCTCFLKSKHFYHGPFDETYYSMRVFESAKQIIYKLKEPCKKELVLVCAILHDVGKSKLNYKKIFGKTTFTKGYLKEWHKHAKLSVPIAKIILKKMGHSDEFIKEASYLIKNHDNRLNLTDKSLELRILQDADLIADIGLAGFVRPFLFSGKFSRSVISQINYIKNEKSRVEIDGMINLKVSKKIADKEMNIQNKLVDELAKDLNSELF